MNSPKLRGQNYADIIFNLFGESDSLDVDIDSAFRDHAIDALEDRGCVVQRELDSTRVTIYLQTNRQAPTLAGKFRLA